MPFGFLREYNDGKSTDKATALEWVILKGNVKLLKYLLILHFIIWYIREV